MDERFYCLRMGRMLCLFFSTITFCCFSQGNIDSLSQSEAGKFDSSLFKKQAEVINYGNRIKNLELNLRRKEEELKRVKQSQELWEIISEVALIIVTVFGIIILMSKRKDKKRRKKLQDAKKNQSVSLNQSSKWIIVGDSKIGKSHIKNGLPCQDSNFFNIFENSWGIAIVCDGAGSAKRSHEGSKFIAKDILPGYLEELVKREKWIEKSELPTQQEWQEKATVEFRRAFKSLEDLAERENDHISQFACTVIAVVFSLRGLLVAHIGDGRAGYNDEEGDWHSMMTPHKGEESNQTIFLSTSAWIKDPKLQMSGVSVPECNVIYIKPSAFVLMSDGCEHHSFECSKIDSETGKWSDPNLPYDKFFSPLTKTIKDMVTSTQSEDIQAAWSKFLESGTEGLRNEGDDKSMILGIFS